MQRKSRIIYGEWLYIILAWIILYYIYFLIAFWGVSDLYDEGIMKNYLGTWYIHIEIIIGATLFGLIFSLINTLIDKTAIRRKSVGFIIII